VGSTAKVMESSPCHFSVTNSVVQDNNEELYDEYIISSTASMHEVEGNVNNIPQHQQQPMLTDVATCEQILDKLLVAAKENEASVNNNNNNNAGFGDQLEWEESFNELFPDLI